MSIASSVSRIIYDVVNEIPKGMEDTPARVERALKELTAGYHMDPKQILATRFESEGYDQVVVLSNVAFVSLCEHHLLPFHGTVDLAYLPSDGRVVGLSKLARLVEVYARRFQIQERMTLQIADAMTDCLSPAGVAVVVRATHLCMVARGVQKSGTVMTTSEMRGLFRDDATVRAEVMRLMEGGRV